MQRLGVHRLSLLLFPFCELTRCHLAGHNRSTAIGCSVFSSAKVCAADVVCISGIIRRAGDGFSASIASHHLPVCKEPM